MELGARSSAAIIFLGRVWAGAFLAEKAFIGPPEASWKRHDADVEAARPLDGAEADAQVRFLPGDEVVARGHLDAARASRAHRPHHLIQGRVDGSRAHGEQERLPELLEAGLNDLAVKSAGADRVVNDYLPFVFHHFVHVASVSDL